MGAPATLSEMLIVVAGVTEDDCLVELDGSQQTAGVWVSVPDGSTVIFTHPPLEKNDD